MQIINENRITTIQKQRGFSLPELLVVLLIIAIIGVIALPQIIASRRQFRFASMQRQMTATLTEARQNAMSQRRAVTFRYDNAGKRMIIYGGSFGAVGDSRNQIESLAGSGIGSAEIIYGRPSGASANVLRDNTNLTNLNGNALEITFQPDGSVIDAGNNPTNSAMFFYHSLYPQKMAFAVSVLGAGGRIKVWRYSENVNEYVE